MLINDTFIEKSCKGLLQKTLTFEIKEKTIKSGKLILFFQRNFHLVFVLDSEKKGREKLEIPIPFKIENHGSEKLTYFDYRISTFSKLFADSEPYLSLYTPKVAKSKFFDTILLIHG